MGCASSKDVTTSQATAASGGPVTAAAAPKAAPVPAENSNHNSHNNANNNHNNNDNGSSTTTTTVSKDATTQTTAGHVPGTPILGRLRIRYACVSRRGRDPDNTKKPNQDAYGIHANFGDSHHNSFFGVYDGHGPAGDVCSQFVQRRLPVLIQQHMAAQQATEFVLATEHIQQSLHAAHTACNEELHAASHIDDTVSGTTSISVYVEGESGRITISNVGDSRAILGTAQKVNSGISTTTTTAATTMKAVPLSKDHTPYRSDEAHRCKRTGARILSFGEISGTAAEDESETEDPPRVWHPHANYPGTAFTRSIGDSRADPLGVIAEPEMMTLKLSENEKIIVLASDGVFDVLSNQQVIDMCHVHHGGDPVLACHAVVDRSHAEWLKNEECEDGDDVRANYDDMTIACIYIYTDEDEENAGATAAAAAPTTTTSNNGNNNTPDAVNNGEEEEEEEDASSSAQPRKRRRARQKTLRNMEDEAFFVGGSDQEQQQPLPESQEEQQEPPAHSQSQSPPPSAPQPA